MRFAPESCTVPLWDNGLQLAIGCYEAGTAGVLGGPLVVSDFGVAPPWGWSSSSARLLQCLRPRL